MKRNLINQILIYSLIVIWCVISGYICIGGLSLIEADENIKNIEKVIERDIFPDIQAKNAGPRSNFSSDFLASLDEEFFKKSDKHLTFEEKEAIINFSHVYWYYSFPGYSFIIFLLIMPYTALLFLTAGAAGLLGSTARIIIDHVRNTVPIIESKFFALPISGFFIGIMVLAISYVIPTVFVQGETNLNSTSVVLLCFFSGIFNDSFYGWIMKQFEKFMSR